MTGLIHIYCGDGKGKTTASVGLAVRCAGRGNKVVFAQFLKDGTSGECRVLAKLPDVTVMAANPVGKFSFRMTEAEKRETADALTRTFDAATGFACGSTRGCSCWMRSARQSRAAFWMRKRS